MKSATSTTQNKSVKHQKIKREINDIRTKKHALEQVELLISNYENKLQKLESTLWIDGNVNETALQQYQHQYRELESLYQLLPADERYHFYITIPVADRPIHLKQCLNSLLKLCQLYTYGGFVKQKYQKIHVIIADDSKDSKNILLNHEIVSFFNAKGLQTEYFSLQAQIQTVEKLTTTQRQSLHRILGSINQPLSAEMFSHKGASITRNISYLRLSEINNSQPDQKKLFYFIDSDQQFCINSCDGKNHYVISYFHHLNAIFKHNDIGILTGKVVGDPPVSPTVMAAKFEDDVLHFTNTIAHLNSESPCQFHTHSIKNYNEASYHDMSSLFGFEDKQLAFEYHCRLKGVHSNADCLQDFASQLNGFFHGEHITRETRFHYTGAFTDISPARTIYTGNYIFKPDNLKYFISFATLKLRMAGPVLGRMLKATMGKRFVSANLPMLHNRTVDNTGKSEFRAGVKNNNSTIDLSTEFEKQYFGDILLFTIEKLCNQGYPVNKCFKQTLMHTLEKTSTEIHKHYNEKHQQILQKAKKLKSIVLTNRQTFSNVAGKADAMNNLHQFIDNIFYNFGNTSKGYRLITSAQHRKKRLTEIEKVVAQYQLDQKNWLNLITHNQA